VYEAQQRHYVRWPILGEYTGTAEVEYPPPATFEGEVDKFKNWISVRLAWLDTNMPGRVLISPSDTFPIDTIPVDTIPVDTIPVDTIPNDTIKHDTIIWMNQLVTERTHLRLFPNPATEIVYIESNIRIMELEIFNSNGILVYRQPVYGKYSVPVDLVDHPPGLYFARIKLEGLQVLTAKFIIKR
jgi:hypothetical protein